ncbi:hypothetical protein SPRG_20142 [Saprolegnia parasitica CBS 223.65]|uniref:Uncharacterized protein n=1 Tax=Saprolegnia parasitica (strain CBS 223.65) TaxID=695850 RepID=A0A067CCT5_SAPPC|nr:hypothetical protein SPRG_20142 [Saprolegnia parasitica CBS 223.65]KDO28574.1 hypothetical protein SPRG_20142 [Saprolegnia parasitica CBS 223.65]|eukprot:XP_012200767.1 hypothetical protein SPRG_20142 [Saprolegnia parasitica CBS 223.65]
MELWCLLLPKPRAQARREVYDIVACCPRALQLDSAQDRVSREAASTILEAPRALTFSRRLNFLQ